MFTYSHPEPDLIHLSMMDLNKWCTLNLQVGKFFIFREKFLHVFGSIKIKIKIGYYKSDWRFRLIFVYQ